MNPKDLDQYFPDDHSRQIDPGYYIRSLAGQNQPFCFVDLGTGPGHSYSAVKKVAPQADWIGIDIEDSPPVRNRKIVDERKFMTYDGVNIPLPSNSVDVLYSGQVFEHVRYPEPLMKDIARVLKEGGTFVGSVSQLEPFHSHSLWNFTYYGFAVLADAAGLQPVEFRPGMDGLTLTLRNFMKFQLRQDVSGFVPWVKGTSPFNSFIDLSVRGDHRELNKAKVRVAGHICFKFRKPARAQPE